MENIESTRIERQNLLNNQVAIENISKKIKYDGNLYDGVYYYTNEQIANFFNVNTRTIERLIEQYRTELEENGYQVLSGSNLQSFRKNADFATDINVGHQVRNLGLSTFRTLLNFAMLLTDSEQAKIVRSMILNITIDTINQKTGGSTKYINQRDRDYLTSLFKEETARKKFTDAIDNFVDGNKFRYGKLTNAIYIVIFKEKASEYRSILKLKNNENVRNTLYSEVLLIIASFENGLSDAFEKKYHELQRKLSLKEAEKIILDLEKNPFFEPLINDARKKMASRDLGFREALHINLEEYISPISESDYEKFLGEQSKSLEEQINEHKDVFLRLRDK